MPHRLSTAMTRVRGRRGLAYVLILAAAIGGATAIVLALRAQEAAPTPPASAAGTISSSPTTPTSGTPTKPAGGGKTTTSPPTQPIDPQALTRSVPTLIDIPAIGVHSAVIPIGQTANGDLAVPQPGPDLNKAAWYENSVTPGEVGPSVIEGHVDSVYGRSVFFDLGDLRPGDQIVVTRADQSVARFTINAVRAYASHADFPRETVFGGDLGEPTLRLITCSNFDSSIGHYLGNTVIYAHLEHS